MIQRIQSVFLVIAAVCMILSLFFPIWHKINPETGQQVVLTADSMTYTVQGNVVKRESNIYIAILAVASAALAFYSIFQYKNMMSQIRVVLFNTLLMCIVLGLMVFENYSAEALFAEPEYGEYGAAYFLPGVALIFNILARRYIKKDIDLIRSADRMR